MIILKITVISLLLKDFKLRTEETDTERAGRRRDREIGQERQRQSPRHKQRRKKPEITYL